MKKKTLLNTVTCVILVSEILLWYNITIKRRAWVRRLTRWALWFAALLQNFIAAPQSLQTIWPYKIQTSSKTFDSRFDDSENFTWAVGRDWDFVFGPPAGRNLKRPAKADVVLRDWPVSEHSKEAAVKRVWRQWGNESSSTLSWSWRALRSAFDPQMWVILLLLSHCWIKLEQLRIC